MEKPKEVSQPCYKRELSIYEKETLKKIEDFRSARSTWITSNANTEMYSTVNNEGLKEKNIYQGRCKFLRKYRISTARLRIHFKTLRPLRFYTLKRQLSDDEVDETEAKPKQRKKKHTCSEIELWPADEPQIKIKPGKEKSDKEKKKIKEKRAKCAEMKMPVPCRQALKRLKAAKLEQSMIESCRCDDGREVTVVIKGICLCDKNSLNNLKLDKVCDEYSRKVASSKETNAAQQKDFPTPGTETKAEYTETLTTETKKVPQESNADEANELGIVSSLEIHKKRIQSRTEYDAPQEDKVSETKFKKAVAFDEEEYNKPEEKRKIEDSDLTIYPRFSNEDFDTESTTTKSELKEAEKKDEKTSELNVVSSTEIYKKKLSRNFDEATNPLETDTDKSTNQLKPKKQLGQLIVEENENKFTSTVFDEGVNKEHHDDLESINHDTNTNEESRKDSAENTKDSESRNSESKDLKEESLNTEKLEITKTDDVNSSAVTLYKNTSEQESEFALTPEQQEVLKKNEINEK